jgi:serine/threonine protein kinase
VVAQTLSHYKILEKIGAGGMGDVYLAEDTTLDRRVALKILPPESAQSDERREILVRTFLVVPTDPLSDRSSRLAVHLRTACGFCVGISATLLLAITARLSGGFNLQGSGVVAT